MPLTCVVATVELPLLRWWHVSEKSCDFLRRAQLRWADERQAWGVADSVTGVEAGRQVPRRGGYDPTCFPFRSKVFHRRRTLLTQLMTQV